MPTVIDALVVELSLDPSNFNDGQKRAADSLGKLQIAAQQSAGRIQESGAGVVSFFRILENPIGSLRRHFETLAVSTQRPRRELADLAAQGRRTGVGIEAGALAGASGLRVMGAAGLGALAVLTLLNKAQSAANEAAVKTFGSGLGAAAAGVPIQEFTATSQALLHKGNVPEEVTQGWMARLRSAQVQAAVGHPEEAIALNTAFAQAGIQANALTDKPEQVLLAIASRFHAVSADVAIGLGELIGQSAVLAKALHDLGAEELQAQISAERQRAATEADSAASDELIKTKNNLRIATDNLGRALLLLLGGPMAKFIDWVAFMAGNLANVAKGKPWEALPEEPQEKGPEATAPIPPRGGAGNWERASSLIQRYESSGGQNIKNPDSDASGPWQILGSTWAEAAPAEGIDINKYPSAMSAPREDQERVARRLWERRGFQPWTVGNPALADALARGEGGDAQSKEGAYGVPGAVMNYGNTGALGPPGSNLTTVETSGGHKVTLNVAAAPSALALLNELEGRGYKIDSLGGFSRRDKAGGSGLSEHAFGTAFDVNPGKNIFRSSNTDLPKDIHNIAAKHGWIWGGDWVSPKDTMHFQWGGPHAGKPWYQKVGDQLSLIQSSKAGDSTTTTHSTTNADTNVGDIHVHVPAGSDGYAIGGAINDTIQRRGSMATQANTGLQ